MDYFNDPELNGKYLGTITKDLVVVCDTPLEASARLQLLNKLTDNNRAQDVRLKQQP